MNVYLSFCSNGYLNLKNEKDLNFIKECFKISSALALKTYKNVYLVTDSIFFNFIKSEVNNWTDVFLVLDNVKKEYMTDVWSVGKLQAYNFIAQKDKPFIHIDYDIFLLNELIMLKDYDIFVNHYECSDHYPYNIFYSKCKNIYACSYGEKYEYIPNMSVFGGKKLDFIYNYSLEALNMVYNVQNKDFFLNKIDSLNGHWEKAVMAEQFFLEAFSRKHNQKINTVFKNKLHCNYDLKNLNIEAAQIGICHLHGLKEKLKNQSSKYWQDLYKKIV